jgi:hypothetical protein
MKKRVDFCFNGGSNGMVVNPDFLVYKLSGASPHVTFLIENDSGSGAETLDISTTSSVPFSVSVVTKYGIKKMPYFFYKFLDTLQLDISVALFQRENGKLKLMYLVLDGNKMAEIGENEIKKNGGDIVIKSGEMRLNAAQLFARHVKTWTNEYDSKNGILYTVQMKEDELPSFNDTIGPLMCSLFDGFNNEQIYFDEF